MRLNLLALTLACLTLVSAEAYAVPAGSVKLSKAAIWYSHVAGKTWLCGKDKSKHNVSGLKMSGYFVSHSLMYKSTKKSKYKKLITPGKAACKASTGGAGGAGSGSQPAPPAGACFDSLGNGTAAFKSSLGIPSSLTANISAGSSTFHSLCQGCHEEKKAAFSPLKSALAGTNMQMNLPDSMIANLVAYLNRLKSGCY
ncbi:MAG: hypothetical protein K1X79_03530 [Oligoflexia bacterium]|nr:hypothetical protein [Oligoflexia bacterium]